MEPVEILRSALELIRDEDHWCTYAIARGKSGRPVKPHGKAAVQWCSLGALIKVAYNTDLRQHLDNVAQQLFGVQSLVAVNDDRGHADVLVMFKQAIADLEAGQP